MGKLWICVAVAFILLAPSFGFGDDFGEKGYRCAGGFVAIGDNKDKVLERCGNPMTKEKVKAVVFRRTENVPSELEDWTYNLGSTDYVYMFRFSGSNLISIRQERRGY